MLLYGNYFYSASRASVQELLEARTRSQILFLDALHQYRTFTYDTHEEKLEALALCAVASALVADADMELTRRGGFQADFDDHFVPLPRGSCWPYP